jgi:stalled ribosome rescue protein Dom34
MCRCKHWQHCHGNVSRACCWQCVSIHQLLEKNAKEDRFSLLPAFSALNQLDCYVLVNVLPADELFRINNVAKRKKYADLVEGVREAGGEALLFSSMHVSGEQLNNLSGIAAVLRFPLPELEDQEIVEEV